MVRTHIGSYYHYKKAIGYYLLMYIPLHKPANWAGAYTCYCTHRGALFLLLTPKPPYMNTNIIDLGPNKIDHFLGAPPSKHGLHRPHSERVLRPFSLQTENYCSSPLHSSVRGNYRRPRIL